MKGSSALASTFAEVFPPPRFLVMPSVGLDISDRWIRCVELKQRHARYSLGTFGQVEVPKGIIEDGVIKDTAKLTDILTEFRKKYNLCFVRASLPEEKSYLFSTSIPKMHESDIRSALQFKIEENVPLTLADAVYDYHISREPGPEDTKIEVSVTVAQKKVVESYCEVLKNAALVPISLHIESQAIAHAAVPRDEHATCIVVAIRRSRTILSIVSEKEIRFSSSVPIGGEVIANSFKKNLDIDDERVEKIRQGREVRESNEMFMSLVNAATAFRDEIQKLITYWEGLGKDEKQNRIEKIILTGSDSMLGIDDYLSRSLDMNVELANPWVNILSPSDAVPALTLREALDYVPALGLALPYD